MSGLLWERINLVYLLTTLDVHFPRNLFIYLLIKNPGCSVSQVVFLSWSLSFFICADNFRWKEQMFFISKIYLNISILHLQRILHLCTYWDPWMFSFPGSLFLYSPTKNPGYSISQEVYFFIHLLRTLDVPFPRKFICFFLYLFAWTIHLRGFFFCADTMDTVWKEPHFYPKMFQYSAYKEPWMHSFAGSQFIFTEDSWMCNFTGRFFIYFPTNNPGGYVSQEVRSFAYTY